MQSIIESLQTILLQYVWPAAAVVITLGIAILLHEFGHFVFARLSGVGVEIFSVGFGKRLWGVKRGETDYRISAIPIGGYVKIKGILSEAAERYLEGEDTQERKEDKSQEEGEGERADSTEPGEATSPDSRPDAERSEPAASGENEKIPYEKGVGLMQDAMDATTGLRDKPWILRVLVFSAGCGFNFLVAVTAFFLVGWIGTDVDAPFPPVVGYVEEGTPLYEAGLRGGDRIVKLDCWDVTRWGTAGDDPTSGVLDVIAERLQIWPGGPLPCVVARSQNGGETTHSLLLPSAAEFMRAASTLELENLVQPAYIAALIPFQPAHKAGLKQGDIVVAIDGEPIDGFHEMRRIVSRAAGQPLLFKIKRGDETDTLVITPAEAANPDDKETTGPGQIGVLAGNAEREFLRIDGFFKAWRYGFQRAVDVTGLIAVETGKLFARFTYREAKQNLAGPLGIFGITFERAREGWEDFLLNMAVINLALMLINILPIPVLDGGHILITTIEGVTRRPIPPRVLATIYNVFFFLLIALILMVTWIDIARFAEWFGLDKIFG